MSTSRRLSAVTPALDPLAYPGVVPRKAWVLEQNRIKTLRPDEVVHDCWRRDRCQLIAIGSNRRPQRLLAHLGRRYEAVVGLPCVVHGADIVYPANVASYGVITATVIPAPQAQIRAWVLLISAKDVRSVARSERLGIDFDLYALTAASVRVEDRKECRAPLAFVHRHGPLPFPDGDPRALSRIQAIDSPVRRVPFRAAHGHAASILKLSPEVWPLGRRAAANANARLARIGLPVAWPARDRMNAGRVLDANELATQQVAARMLDDT